MERRNDFLGGNIMNQEVLIDALTIAR